MSREITQRELRNESGRIMRALDDGESFIITRNGTPVGELKPIQKRFFVRSTELLASVRGLPPVDRMRFRHDVDAVLDQDPTPRG